MILPPKPFGSSGRNLGYSLRLDRTHRDSWLSVDSCCDQAKSYVIPNDVAEGRSGRRTQELRQNGVCWSVTAVSSEALSAGSRWPFSRVLESRNSILST